MDAPVPADQRLLSIDVLRGVAVLGILVLNIQSFAMPGAAYINPNAYGDLDGANYRVWYFSQLLGEQKFMTIFSMLFGAGIVLMTSRAEARRRGSASVHYRRMGWLILFGLLHAHLLWYGDILYSYGMCGLIAWLFRKLPPAVLVPLGLVVVGVGSGISLATGFTMPHWGEAAVQDMQQSWLPPPDVINAELSAYRGSWLEQMRSRVPTAIFFETLLFLIAFSWRAGGLMLVGMGLFKLGIFSAARSAGTYLALAVIGLGLGLPVVWYGIQEHEAHAWAMKYSFFIGNQFNYWGSLLVSLGYVSLTMLACKADLLRPITRPLADVGRMALTNYLLQTIICTTIFYGHGLGLFGSVERIGQISIVLGVWILQLVLSPIWLSYFRYGPFEWLWRSLTYWRIQPMKKSPRPRDDGLALSGSE